ncbi:IS110 family transposase [Paenibacillus sp. HB172176]|uniref:IS110 family transposase n=1 Tax=Paenibacillus sp. HB172176 TaxID=2493690 RepID=UPI00143C1341|nr:IS110 family transposase [Paenibacillus sp. HB172176]
MDAIRECCAGLDVHQETVVACVLKGRLDRKPVQTIETFGTTTKELLRLQNFLIAHECKDVVMESTGVLWKPVWNILEPSCNLVVANPRRVKNLPGRKTDMKDAQWLAKLHRCGLIPASMIPEEKFRDLRDLTRYRRKLIQAASSEKNRIHKILQDANIKLTTYVSDLFGVSGRALLQKLMDGEVLNEEEIKKVVKTKLIPKAGQLVEALNGKVRLHHREMITSHSEHLAFLENQIERLGIKIEMMLDEYKETIERIDSVPGIERNTAMEILAEIGPNAADLFPSDAHLAAWAGLSPGNSESAGKSRKSKTVKGNKYIKSALCQSAWANSRSNNRIGIHFRRIRKRRGDKKANVATAHLLLRILFALIRDQTMYEEKKDMLTGGSMSEEKMLAGYLMQIQKLGYQVQLNKETAS